MNNEIKLHYFQAEIVKLLTKSHGLKFNEIVIKGLESEHMNYHLKKLIEFKFVEKLDDKYVLTDKGKDYCNLLDDNVEIIEKQPKTSIIIRAVRKNSKGEVEFLLTKRLRHPYFGKVGKISGKVRFGEKLEEAAARELFEETGLIAQSYTLESIYHKIRNREDGTCVQDVIFYTFFVTGIGGDFISLTPHQENLWVTEEFARNNLDLIDDSEFNPAFELAGLSFSQSVGVADGY